MAKALAFLIAGLLVFFGGSIVGIGMVLDAHTDRRVLSEGVRTIGVVTNVGFSTGGRQHEYKDLTVSFLTLDRSVYTKGSRGRYYAHIDGSKPAAAEALQGQRMVVFYDRADPSKSVIEGAPKSFAEGYLVIIFSAAFGASFIWTGWVGLRRQQA